MTFFEVLGKLIIPPGAGFRMNFTGTFFIKREKRIPPGGIPVFKVIYKQKKRPQGPLFYTGDRTRTDTGLLPADFESAVSTNFTTPADHLRKIAQQDWLVKPR